MRCWIVRASICMLLIAGIAKAGDLRKARNLLDIADYAGAVAQLGEIINTEPSNVEARLLMGICFAMCEFDLQLPGPVVVGKSNRERALYQFGILARLGKDGPEKLVEAIGAKNSEVVAVAMEAAGKAKLASAVDVIAAVIASKDASDPKQEVFRTADLRTGMPVRTDASRTLRSIGVSALSQIGGDKAAMAILAVLDMEPPVRRLGLLWSYAACVERPVAAATVRKLLDSQPETIRPGLCGMYVSLLDEKAVIHVAEKEKDPGVVAALAGRIEMQPALPSEALAALARREDVSEWGRTAAIKRLALILGKSDPKAAADVLAGLLADKSPEVRRAALSCLADVDSNRAIPHLVADLGDSGRAFEALRTLERIKSPASIKPLTNVLATQADPARRGDYKVPRQAVFSVIAAAGPDLESLYVAVKLVLAGDSPDSSSRLPALPKVSQAAIFDRLLAEKDPALRRAAIAAVSDLQPADRASVIRKAMLDQEPKLRLAALHCGEQLDAKDHLALAVAAAGDGDLEVRREAGRRILTLADRGIASLSQLVPLLGSDDEWVMSSAAAKLARSGDASFAEAFIALLKDAKRSRTVVGSLAAYFAKNPDRQAVPLLIAALGQDGATGNIQTVRDIAAVIKAAAPDRAAAAKDVAKHLASTSFYPRLHAAVVLQILGEKAALPDLIAAARKAPPGSERDAIDAAIRTLSEEKK